MNDFVDDSSVLLCCGLFGLSQAESVSLVSDGLPVVSDRNTSLSSFTGRSVWNHRFVPS